MLLVKTKLQSFFVLTCVMSMLMATTGCSSKEKNSDTPEGAFAIAQELDKDELWDRAIQKYQEVKNKFPYSKYATMAELAIADAQYKDELFAEAQVSYQSFKDLHPKHPQIDYVTFRLAMSFYKQLPSTIDRDLTLASSAILYFDEVLNKYPNSEHTKEARENRDASYKMLAEKEKYIADFYFKRGVYDSALSRYEGLLRKYPGFGFEAHALSQAAISAARAGDQDKSKKYLQELQSKFSSTPELENARKEIRE